MSRRDEVNRIKRALAAAAEAGVLAFLSTPEGAQLLGADASTFIYPDDPRVVGVDTRVEAWPTTFEIYIKEIL